MTTSNPSTPPVDAGTVEVEIEHRIATVRFGHPKGNSLPSALLAELAARIDALGKEREAHAIILRSEGVGPFCAGASFDELSRITDQTTGTAFFMGFARLILAMTRATKPIIARVHGKIAGGGIGMVAAADYAIATQNASARLSELAIGIGPFVVGPAIEKKIGLAGFQAMAFDTEWRDAAWCERVGLYARTCVSTEELDNAVFAMAHKLATSNPDATALIKRVCWEGTEHWETLLPERAAMSGALVLSDFTKQAIAAFGKR